MRIASGVSSARPSSWARREQPLDRRAPRAAGTRRRPRAGGRSRASISSSASACGAVRGKPSRTKPRSASSLRRAGRGSASIMRSSGTSSPRVEERLRPAAELGAVGDRALGGCRRSRCAGCRTPRRSASPGFPCPRPAGRAGGCRAASLLEEAFVGAHHHLRLHLAHRVERDADDDQHRGASERARGRLREAAVADEEASAARRRPPGRASRAASAASARGRGTAPSAAPGGCPGCSRRACAGCRPGRPG